MNKEQVLEWLNNGVAPERINTRLKLTANYDKEAIKQGNPTSESNWENFKAGVGQGMSNIVANIGEIAGVDGAADYLKEHKELDAPLLNTKAGLAGSVIGQTAATLPLTMGVAGGVAKGAAALSRAPVGGLASAGNYLSKSHPAARGIMEGAVQGGLAAGPDRRAGGAAFGAAMSPVMRGVGKGVGNLAGRGMVGLTEGAKTLKKSLGAAGLDDFIPIGAGGDPNKAITSLYKEMLPNVPVIGSRLITQAEKLSNNWRNLMMRMGSPKKLHSAIDGGDIQGAIQMVDDFAQSVYFMVDSIPMNTGVNFMPATLKDTIAKMSPKAGQFLMKQLQGVKDGKQLMALRNSIGNTAKWKSLTIDQRKALKAGIDDLIDDNLRGGPFTELADDLIAVRGTNAQLNILKGSSVKAIEREGQFDPKDILGAVKDKASELKAATGQGPLQSAAHQAQSTVGDTVENPGFWRRLALLGFVRGLGNSKVLGTALAPVTAATSRTGQKILTGQTRPQEMIAKGLDNPYVSGINKRLGRFGRGAAVDYMTGDR